MQTLDEVISLLKTMPEEQRNFALKEADKFSASKPFIPNLGPQTEAYFSKADVLLYGGSPGGGKTALEIGLALNEHDRSLILRREFVDLSAPIHTLENILNDAGIGTKGLVRGNRPLYRKPNDGIINFMGLGDDFSGKQGLPHDLICVHSSTPVLMANNYYKPISQIKVGEYVQTLSGPKKVLRSFPTAKKKAVAITANGVSQIQSTSHKLLTINGWHSRKPCYQTESSAPKECYEGRKFYEWSLKKFEELRQFLFRHNVDQGQDFLVYLAALPTVAEALLASDVYRVQGVQGNDSEGSGDGFQVSPLHLLLSAWKQGPFLPLQRLGDAWNNIPHYASWYDGGDVQKMSLQQDCLDYYLENFHQHGERTRVSLDQDFESKRDPIYPLLLVDVELQNPSGLQEGGEAAIPRRTSHKWWYAHPYMKGICQSNLRTSAASFKISPVNDTELYDIEVAEVNHYITKGGFVNKNCFDEAAQFPESYVRMCIGWLRTRIPGQRCRAILASNPPLDSVGDWLIDYFAPWLNEKYPNPAMPGELRYFNPSNNDECGKDDKFEINGITVSAQSRTYIPSKFTDNPFYNADEYAKSLAGLPDSVRERLITGNFMLARQDDEWQAIRTDWVRQAQARWTINPPANVPMCCIGVDVAQGGADFTVLAPRYDGWYAPLISVPGVQTPDGPSVAGLVIQHRRDGAAVVIDMGGGYGGSVLDHLKQNIIALDGRKIIHAYKGAEGSTARTADRHLGFTNKRSEAYWRFREALDPSQEQGSIIALPDDPELVADLTAPRFEVTSRGIKIESKEDVLKRLGRSPDKGDAVVMAWMAGKTVATQVGGWKTNNESRPQVKRG